MHEDIVTMTTRKPVILPVGHLLTVFMLLVFLSGIFAQNGYARQNNILSQNHPQKSNNSRQYIEVKKQGESKYVVSMKVEEIKLTTVLQVLTGQMQVGLSYDSDANLDHTISLQAENAAFYDVLDRMLGGTGLEYLVAPNRNTLVIRPRKEKEPEQQETITGRVTDAETGEALPGVNVVVMGSQEVTGSTIGTQTNMNGGYSVVVPDGLHTVVFSYVGYRTVEIAIEGRTEIDVELQTEAITGQELVVVGYGTQRAEEVTGSISSVKSEDFVTGTITDAAQLIQGKVAGLNVVTPDANPTSSSQINLRGVNTLRSSSSPLVLIDGVPGHIREISPEEIESIDVLKGGAAAAIYGTRGSNGVILITTKSISGDIPPTIRINSYINTQQITRKLNFMNAGEYRQKVSEGITGAIDQGSNTDWLEEVTQTPVTQVHDVSLLGGNSTTSYILSLRYSDQDGIMRRSNNRTLYPRIEVNHTMFEGILDLEANLSGYEQSFYSGARGGGYNPDIYYNALIYNPTAPVNDEAGDWFQNLNRHAYDNPVGLLEETEGENQNDKLKYYGRINIHPLEYLSIRFLGSQDRTRNFSGYYETKAHTSTLRNSLNGYAYRGAERNQEDLFEVTVEYEETFSGDHDVTALTGYSWNKINYQSYGMENWDFPTDTYDFNNMGAGLALSEGIAEQSSYQSESKLISYFFRLNYNFQSRYLLSGSIRHEGSTKFGENHKWATFPAISAGWNIHNESFSRSIPFSTLRLRAGFGITGTAPSEPYPSLSNLNFDQRALIDGNWIQANLPSSNPNPDLRWETKEELDLGLDFGLLENRISGSLDFYQRTTKDMLWGYSVPSPPYLFDTIIANAATMENKGIEVQLNARLVQKTNFVWNSTINFSTNRNKITSLSNDRFQLASGFFDAGSTGEPILQSTHRVEIGKPVGNFYGYKSIGIDENGRWIIEGRNGEPKPISEQQAEDKQVLGNGFPDHNLSWNNTLAYKNLDLSMQMRGAFGFQIMNMPRMFYEPPINLARGNVLRSAFDEVFGERVLSLDQELQYVNYYIEDGDYWKISNITLGYNLNNIDRRLFIKNLRVYVSASNVATITGYSGIDPEVSIASLTPGVDRRHRYPAARTFTLGVNLTF